MSERTFDPTPRHAAEMRRKGDLGLSAELAGAVALVVAIYALISRLGSIVNSLEEIMRQSFTSLAEPQSAFDNLWGTGLTVSRTLSGVWLPFMLFVAFTGVIATLVQSRGVIAWNRMKPDLGRVNPAAGIKRMVSPQSLFETGKGLLKMAILGGVLYSGLREAPTRLAAASLAGFGPGIAMLGDTLGQIARQAAIFLLVAGGIDYFYQFRKHRQRLKMTREEVTEEARNAEGQPMLKAKIRELQRRMSRRRMMQQLVYADVVVTNPTHLAIALRYDAKKMAAPVVLAKGKGLIAAQIVRKARDLRIPIVQNIPLAHALIEVELDAAVPVALYQAVAEVLAFVYRLRRAGQGAVN